MHIKQLWGRHSLIRLQTTEQILLWVKFIIPVVGRGG